MASTSQKPENSGILGLDLMSLSSVALGKSLSLSGIQQKNEGVLLISISQSIFRGTFRDLSYNTQGLLHEKWICSAVNPRDTGLDKV